MTWIQSTFHILSSDLKDIHAEKSPLEKKKKKFTHCKSQLDFYGTWNKTNSNIIENKVDSENALPFGST